jgi:hypothetical protein
MCTVPEAMKRELLRIQEKQLGCINDYGVVKTGYRNIYMTYVRQAEEVRKALEQWEKFKENGWKIS